MRRRENIVGPILLQCEGENGIELFLTGSGKICRTHFGGVTDADTNTFEIPIDETYHVRRELVAKADPISQRIESVIRLFFIPSGDRPACTDFVAEEIRLRHLHLKVGLR